MRERGGGGKGIQVHITFRLQTKQNVRMHSMWTLAGETMNCSVGGGAGCNLI